LRLAFGESRPWLPGWVLVIVGEIEDPVRVDELVAELDLQPLEGRLQEVIVCNAFRAHEQHEIRGLTGLARGCLDFLLTGDAAFDLGPSPARVHRDIDRQALWMEDQPGNGAFDVQRAPAFAAPAMIGNHRISLFFPFARSLEVLEGLFEQGQVRSHPGEGHLLCGGLLVGVAGNSLASGQGFLFASQSSTFRLELVAHLGRAGFLGPQARGRLGELLADFLHLRLQDLLLTHQPIVQGVAFLFPGGSHFLLLFVVIGAQRGGRPLALLHLAHGGLPGFLMNRAFGLAIHDQQ
jgi:hypothetical protein